MPRLSPSVMSCARKGDTFSENYDNYECRVLTNCLSLCTCSFAEGLRTGGLLCCRGASPWLQLVYISSSVLALPEDQDYAGHEYSLCVSLRSVSKFILVEFTIDTDIADLLFQELEVSAFLVVLVLIITLSGIDYQRQVIRIAASGLPYERLFLFAPTRA